MAHRTRFAVLLVVASLASACGTTLRPYATAAAPRQSEHHTDLRVAVVRPVDERLPQSRDDSTAWLVVLPYLPYSSNYFDRPEEHGAGVNDFGTYLAQAIEQELVRSGLFASVRIVDRPPSPDEFDVVVRSRVHETLQRQLYTAYGFSIDGPFFWLIGAPSGFDAVTLDLSLSLVATDHDKPLFDHRKRLEHKRWRSIWWGPRSSDTQNEAVGMVLTDFLDQLEPQLPAIAAAVEREKSSVARTTPRTSLKAGKLAVLALKAGDALSTDGAQAVNDYLVAELSQRVTSVIGASDIQNMLGFERIKDLVGCSDSSCMAEIGGALGVDYLVAPSLGHIGDYVVLSLSLMDIAHASVAARVTRKLPADDVSKILDLLPAAVDELLAGMQAPST